MESPKLAECSGCSVSFLAILGLAIQAKCCAFSAAEFQADARSPKGLTSQLSLKGFPAKISGVRRSRRTPAGRYLFEGLAESARITAAPVSAS